MLDVEKDPQKLVNFVCGANYMIEGGEEVPIKPDSEYPDWLFTMNVTRPGPPLEELDPDTIEYWLKVKHMETLKRNRIHKKRGFH